MELFKAERQKKKSISKRRTQKFPVSIRDNNLSANRIISVWVSGFFLLYRIRKCKSGASECCFLHIEVILALQDDHFKNKEEFGILQKYIENLSVFALSPFDTELVIFISPRQ